MGLLRGFVCLLVGWIVAAASVAQGGTTLYEWNSPTTGNWNDPTKWTPGGIPGATEETDEVSLGSGAGSGGTAIIDSAAPSITRFNIGNGGPATLEIRPGGSLATTTTNSTDAIGLNAHGELRMSGGSLTLGRRFQVNDGLVEITGGILTMPDTLIGDFSLGIISLGELTVGGTGRLDVGRDLKIGDGGQGNFSLGGAGQVNVGRNLILGAPLGTGEATITGGQLDVTGTLTVGGPAGVGTLNLQTATATINANAFDVSADGTLSLQLGASLSPIRATSASLVGELTAAIAGNPAVGTVYPLVRVGGDTPHVTTFAGKAQGAVFLAAAAGDAIPLRIDYQANLDSGAVANDVTLTVFRRGDVTLDGAVNRADLARIVANWNGSGGYEQGDLDGDGFVGLADLMTLQRHLGGAAVAGAAAVPEPAAWSMLLAAMALVPVFSRRGLARRAWRR